jgi:hypothetical protein
MLWQRTPAYAARVDGFFAAIDTPIKPDEVPARQGNPSAGVLGVSTIAVGLLLAIAGLASGSSTAVTVDLSVGAILVAAGLWLRRGR